MATEKDLAHSGDKRADIYAEWLRESAEFRQDYRRRVTVLKAEDKVMRILAQPTVAAALGSQASAMQNFENEVFDNLNQSTVGYLNNLQSRSLLPFGREFFYKNLKINGGGDLLAEIRWKTHNP